LKSRFGTGPALSEPDIQPNWPLVLIGTAAVAILSAGSLPWPIAVLSTALGALMLAGADVDAQAYLLPDAITASTLACGVVAALALEPLAPWGGVLAALTRAAATAGALAALRFGYWRLKGREGIGVGDIKLAACVGAWLPLEHIAPCFALAAFGGLIHAALGQARGHAIEPTSRIPFGAFLCPALWLVFYVGALPA
jgi:leader peptidase (prepilin peptidase)/N-methyltransferase